MAPRPSTRVGSTMIPGAVAKVGGFVAKEVARGVVDHALKKKADKGRRLGGPRSSSKKIEEGIKRVIAMGLEKVEEVGGMKNLMKRGLSRIKKEGFVKVAEDVLNFASQGLVRFVNPPGFAAVFKPSGTCQLVFKRDSLEDLRNPKKNYVEDLRAPTLQMENVIPWDHKHIEVGKTWTNVDIKEEPDFRKNLHYDSYQQAIKLEGYYHSKY